MVRSRRRWPRHRSTAALFLALLCLLSIAGPAGGQAEDEGPPTTPAELLFVDATGDPYALVRSAERPSDVAVRVDGETSKSLDHWVETGAVKSRSEAAALFIREGLKVRTKELDRLRDALDEVQKAKQNLRDRAREVFGDEEAAESDATGEASEEAPAEGESKTDG